MVKQTVRDIPVKNKRVFVRVDFNVPLDKKTGRITDNNRIRAALPTIRYLSGQGAKIILASHLGRPDGRVVENLRMGAVADELAKLLGKPVNYVPEITGPVVDSRIKALNPGEVLLLENLRFVPGEEANDPAFSRQLADLADVYVDDAFAVAHRDHASVSGITQFLPACAGLLMEKEINSLRHILENPGHPFGALLGGAKISDKIGLIQNIMNKVDRIMIGGAMTTTFLKALNSNNQIGKSLFEPDRIPVAAEVLARAQHNGVKILIPVDVIVANDKAEPASARVVSINAIPADFKIVDIGPETIAQFKEQIRDCRTLFWNGPMGIYETAEFAKGTREMAETLANLEGATTVIGGGSTAEVVEALGLAPKMTFVSTGGGASLTFLNGERMPGIESLPDKKK